MKIIPRRDWTSLSNAREPYDLAPSRVNAITLHYPGASKAIGVKSKAETAGMIRGWRNYHVNSRGWKDIGYNFAVDQAGRVWNLTGFNVGAHANTVGNTTSIGVLCILGNTEQPSAKMVAAIKAFRKWVLTKTAFTGAKKVQGHQQVPGNSTSCPGRPLMNLIASGKLTSGEVKPPNSPGKVNVLEASNYPSRLFPRRGAKGNHITWLGERLVAHGYSEHYEMGPGPNWGSADRKNLRDFQRAQGWTGTDADGYPGPTTLKLLASPPKSKKLPKVITYVVVKGDSLSKIAKKYSTTVEQLVKDNKIANPNRIHVGQKLLVVPGK